MRKKRTPNVKKHLRLSFTLLLSGLVCTLAMAAPLELETEQGVLVGEQSGTVASFKSIPFAVPPIGDLRWKEPKAAPAWRGKRLATEFSPQCSQEPYPLGSMFTRPSPPSSEDCLYLNVWTANVDAEKPAAVMVWIHGGALTRGTGGSAFYDGTKLAEKGVVLVTINYRLGPFGYLAHSELTQESEHSSSGNYGTLDQIEALKWVQNNIASFGGDPSNVTIFGESAGSWSVNHLTASPLAAGLFQRAIGQSGAKFDPMPLLLSESDSVPSAQATGERFAEHLEAKEIAQLRRLSSDEILDGFATFESQSLSQPNVDGWVFPDHIAKIYRDGKQNDVSLLIGSNADEGTNLMAAPKDANSAHKMFEQMGGEFTDQLLAVYNFEKDFTSASYAMFRDMIFTWNMTRWATLASDRNKDTWLYYFTFVPPAPMEGKLGAYHAAEIRYVFNNESTTFDGSKATRSEAKLGDMLSDYWVNFAKTGVPSSEKGTAWPRYDRVDMSYMTIDKKFEVKRNLLQRELNIVNAIMARRWQD
ncbi:MAG: carboxylesterase family protein [Pseudomonadales bacterium]|nr:carboxylesterase family protein [Pseudomonadales bacterium]MDG1443482.1 carboxylesterase family protein [Pseudomonadales bacterium]